MPIYEYHCPSCGHHMEELQNLSEAPLTHCPECGKETLEKKVSAAGFQLKGTGWYETDFKNKKAVTQPKQEKADATADTKTEVKSEVSTKKEDKNSSAV